MNTKHWNGPAPTNINSLQSRSVTAWSIILLSFGESLSAAIPRTWTVDDDRAHTRNGFCNPALS